MGRGRLSTTITKDFFLSPQWVSQNAYWMDHFCDLVARNVVAVRTGSYVGNGLVKQIVIGDLPQTPIFAFLQPALGGTPFLTLTPYPTAPITAWTREGFTLAAGGAYNTAFTSYLYLVLA